MPGLYAAGDYDLAGFLGRRGGTRRGCCRAVSRRATFVLGLASSGLHSERVFARAAKWWSNPA
jgi:phosphoribosylaminoimidazole (AIR) synthetase